MGRSNTRRYEITPEIKELQRLAQIIIPIGYSINIDITQDLVTINGWRKLTYKEAKTYIEEVIANLDNQTTTSTVPDHEAIAKEEKRQAKLAKKHREPGAPAELKTVIRRAKRIYKKTLIKFPGQTATAIVRAKAYITKKAATPEDQVKAEEFFNTWTAKQ